MYKITNRHRQGNPMRLIPRHMLGNVPLAPGHWRDVMRHGDKPDSPDRIIKFSCPLCGTEGELSDHEIDGDGWVTPSVVCPNDCGFHDHIQLQGWGEYGDYRDREP